MQQNFVRSKYNYWFFSKNEKGKKLFVLSWVNNLDIAGSSLDAIEELKKTRETKFKMDDWGKLEWFLSMQINEDSEKITLDQETYIESVLEKISMQDSNPSKTLAENNLKLVKATEVEQRVDETFYRSFVGSLLYKTNQTRLDMVWIISVFSRFMVRPANSHWLDGKRVLRYLQATKSIKLVYPRDSDYNLTGESDADWSGHHDDQQLVISSNWDSGREQSAGKPRNRRQRLSLPATLNIRVQQQQQSKRPFSWDHWCVRWASNRCIQQWLVKITKAASNWLPTLLCINDPCISIQNIIS